MAVITANIAATLGDQFTNGFGYRLVAKYFDTDNYRQHNHDIMRIYMV